MRNCPIDIFDKRLPPYQQVGIDGKSEVSPITATRLARQASSGKGISEELDDQSESRTFGAAVESHQSDGPEDFHRILSHVAGGKVILLSAECA